MKQLLTLLLLCSFSNRYSFCAKPIRAFTARL
jgi:hypothetical protein